MIRRGAEARKTVARRGAQPAARARRRDAPHRVRRAGAHGQPHGAQHPATRASRSRSGTARPSKCDAAGGRGRARGAHAARAGGGVPTWWSPASRTRTRWAASSSPRTASGRPRVPASATSRRSTISPGLMRRVAEALRGAGRGRAGGAGHRIEDRRREGHAAAHDRRPARAPRRADARADGHRVEGDPLRRDGPGLGREADRQHAHLLHARGPLRGRWCVARKAGVPLETLLEVVMASGFASPYFAFKGAAIARRDFDAALLDRPAA